MSTHRYLPVEQTLISKSYHRLIKERGVDFILCPAYIGAGAKLESVEYFPYTSAWNILDMPCITFPSGLKVDPDIDIVDKDYVPRSAKDKREFEACKSPSGSIHCAQRRG